MQGRVAVAGGSEVESQCLIEQRLGFLCELNDVRHVRFCVLCCKVLGFGVEFVKTNGLTIGGDTSRMMAAEFAWLFDTAGMGDDADFMGNAFGVVGDTHGFEFRIQTALKFFIVGGDAGGTGIFITLHGLNAAKREHKATC